jgi:hypothetical protein
MAAAVTLSTTWAGAAKVSAFTVQRCPLRAMQMNTAPAARAASYAAQMWPRVHPPCARRDLLGETRAGVAVSLGSGSRTDLVGLRIRHPVQPSRSTGAGVLIQTGENTDSATEFQ